MVVNSQLGISVRLVSFIVQMRAAIAMRGWATFQRGFLYFVLVGGLWMSLSLTSLSQSSNLRLESRVDRLEAELSRVRSQLTRLEAAINRPVSSQPVPSVEIPSPVDAPSLDEQFDNLAILAIELKQDMRQLEQRVAALEQAD